MAQVHQHPVDQLPGRVPVAQMHMGVPAVGPVVLVVEGPEGRGKLWQRHGQGRPGLRNGLIAHSRPPPWRSAGTVGESLQRSDKAATPTRTPAPGSRRASAVASGVNTRSAATSSVVGTLLARSWVTCARPFSSTRRQRPSPHGALESVLAPDHQLIGRSARTFNPTPRFLYAKQPDGYSSSNPGCTLCRAPQGGAPPGGLRRRSHLQRSLIDRRIVLTSSNHR